MVFALKPLLESGGVTLTSIGGSESLGPPAGGIMFAQPVRTTIFEMKRITRKKGEIIFIKILPFIKRAANLTCLYLKTVHCFLIILKNRVNPGSHLPIHVMQRRDYSSLQNCTNDSRACHSQCKSHGPVSFAKPLLFAVSPFQYRRER